MADADIIRKLRESGLRGRGGAGFLTCMKWQAVKNAPGEKKYVICNVSEGEPGVAKDGRLLKKHPKEVIEGIRLAVEFLGAERAYIYLRDDYYESLDRKLEKLCKGLPIENFREPGGYLCGEETTLIESMEKKRCEPRDRPPYPTEEGLFGCPTLVNNVETFYYVSKISEGKYQGERLYTISGDAAKKGVFELPEFWPIEKILKKTGNWPKFEFFVQAGGGASGEVLAKEELSRPATGAGAIIVYNKEKVNPYVLMKKWIDFYAKENCGKCAPCREGVYRIREALKKKKIDWDLLRDILFAMQQSSFCPLGKGVATPFLGLIEKIYNV